jgi:alpha-N-arabinofuranosidase
MKKQITRRQAVRAAGAGVFSVLSARAAAGRQRVVVHANDQIGVIRPELHGHFAEHLGNCTYGGLWVGKNSPIPNIDGYRKQAVEYLKAVGIPVLRWPGGCFADDYHWRDGIGEFQKRPRRINLWWGQYTEDNSFGTHEFLGLCRLIGAQPYLAGNVGSGTPRELRDWVEYCNFPSGSTLSDERIANGAKEPFGIRYWGVGNENWGCGGRMTPEEYATLYRRFATYLSARGGIGPTEPYLIACGPSRNDLGWTRRFMDNMHVRNMIQGYAMHFYSRGKSNATKFTVETMREQLSTFADLEKAILDQRALLDKYDKDRRIGLLIDEWGVWDLIPPEDEKRNGRLWQQITMRSAVAAALGLNVFHRQADKLVMGNIAQTVNVLHSLLLTEQEKCIRTSTYWVFDMLKAHRAKTAVRVETGEASPLGLSVSASRQGGELVFTLVNPKHDETMAVDCALDGASAAAATASLLHHPDFNACNTFDNPNRIVPKEHAVKRDGARLLIDLPPMSVLTAAVRLA